MSNSGRSTVDFFSGYCSALSPLGQPPRRLDHALMPSDRALGRRHRLSVSLVAELALDRTSSRASRAGDRAGRRDGWQDSPCVPPFRPMAERLRRRGHHADASRRGTTLPSREARSSGPVSRTRARDGPSSRPYARVARCHERNIFLGHYTSAYSDACLSLRRRQRTDGRGAYTQHSTAE